MARILIVTRTKNRGILLRRAINSVSSQTYHDWHHVIVNDGGSLSDIENILSELPEKDKSNTSVIHNNISFGMEHASNIGIKSHNSELIAIHDDDDTWEKNFLEKVVAVIDNNNYCGVVCHTSQIFEEIKGKSIIKKSNRYFDPLLNNKISHTNLEKKNQFLPISFVFTRRAYNELGGYDEAFQVCGDWDFHYRFLKRYPVFIIKERLANYHIRTSTSNTCSDITNSVKKTSLHKKYTMLFYEKHNIDPNARKFPTLYDNAVLKTIRQLYRFLLK